MDSDPVSSNIARQWKWGLLSAVLLAFITSLPQIYLCYLRGQAWNGSCAYLDTDELPYEAYTNALIDGRPRRNDPYTGRDGGEFETLFSIQFLPAYTLALPARLLGVSSSTAFIFLLPLATVAAAFVVWWLLLEVTDNTSLAIVGAVGILSLGTAAAHSPLLIFQDITTGYDFFPFLRRHVPALPFPIFLASTLFVWRALTRNIAWAVVAGLSFAILVYSYFFLWTAAVAWFFTLAVLWFLARPNDRMKVTYVFGILGGIGTIALLPYVWLLMHRSNIANNVRILEPTHTPDLFRAPELYGAFALGVLAYHLAKGRQSYHSPKILFAASFAVAPFLVFNQQIVTGRSLQPFHYEEFVTNYWVVLAVFLLFGILRREIPKRIITYLAVGGIGIALMLGVQAARLTRSSNVRFDEVRAVALRLRHENLNGLVFASDFRLTNSIPAIARNPVLWSRHMYTFSNIDSVEQKKRYFQHLYYSGFDENRLSELLRTDFFARWEVFGAERANPMLTANPEPITEEEIHTATREYASFVKSFDAGLAGNPLLAYAIVTPDRDLSNLDRWYERGEAERSGEFIIFPLTLKVPH
ncbi:MAG TPA: hypothetical protein VGW76_20245 [Pyrinomonadaceae bacterium]|nr:hypothetical protein [Pyrinomonadaceae bacterium]